MSEADNGTRQAKKCAMYIFPTLVAECQSAETAEPSQCTLYYPTIPAQTITGVYAFAGDAAK